MDKRYTDSQVRGERSNHPEEIKEKGQQMKLFFTEMATEKYKGLTGSQRTFIDRELDDLKFSRDNTASRRNNAELKQTIVFEKQSSSLMVTDILFEPYRKSSEYQQAQIRMENMNNLHLLFVPFQTNTGHTA